MCYTAITDRDSSHRLDESGSSTHLVTKTLYIFHGYITSTRRINIARRRSKTSPSCSKQHSKIDYIVNRRRLLKNTEHIGRFLRLDARPIYIVKTP
ncbi:hypothetical protein [Parasitella parasitica]|uniref:Uncharacterized protein n=1 Tax=Parasitella parasitica TaxID=35722 RepID=A0A0B7N860_9FUNG|nr:hypothetical protein [Parasitella parasitica]